MNEALAQLQFLRPDWLWTLLALPLLAAGWWWRRRSASTWRRHVDPHLLPYLIASGAARRDIAGLLALLLGWALGALALAGPSWRQSEAPLQAQGDALVVALDLSDAMLASDLPPSRTLQARAKLATLLQERDAGDVALLAFADDAYTVAPLTADAANVALFLDALAPDVMPLDGHRPDRAILAAMRLLQQAGHATGGILLMTHAADDAAVAAAARARAAGYQVSVLGLGRPGGATFRARDGGLRSTRLDSATLQQVAAAGGGSYATLTAGDDDLAALGVLSGAATAASRPGVRGTAQVALDQGWWLLPPLMLLALLVFRRGAMVAVLATCLLLPMPPLQAAQPAPATPWRRADQVEHARMREALDAYRAGRFDEAAKTLRTLPGADAAYNQGNALARAGRLEEALEAYDESLRRQPGMADAIANRAVVEAALQRKPPPGGGGRRERPEEAGQRDGRSEDGGDGTAASPAEPAEDGSRQDGAAADSPPPPEDPADRAPPGPPPTAGDEGSQREADAAQRQRMQRALEEGQQPAERGERRDSDPDQAETEAERERRQAGEAWLRRVPDDPGGLLRARFRLEHQRRHGGGPSP